MKQIIFTLLSLAILVSCEKTGMYPYKLDKDIVELSKNGETEYIEILNNKDVMSMSISFTDASYSSNEEKTDYDLLERFIAPEPDAFPYQDRYRLITNQWMTVCFNNTNIISISAEPNTSSEDRFAKISISSPMSSAKTIKVKQRGC